MMIRGACRIARRLTAIGAAALLLSLLLPAAACAEVTLGATRVASGFALPLYAASPPGDDDRMFVVEQHSGQIRIMDVSTGAIDPTPFLNLSGLSAGGEQGLLGLAFDPDYADNGYLYVNFTDTTRATNIRRYQVSGADPDVADPGSATTILTFSQPQSNHNGGWIGFGPDGYLYIATGDGGGSNDNGSGHTSVTGNAQDTTGNLLGKMLRIDPTPDGANNYTIPADNPFVGAAGDDEIWAYGLRNPWRASFDRKTSDLWIADVGQNAREEVDFQPADSSGGENYGWRRREGFIATPTGGVGGTLEGAVEPIHDYVHPGGASRSITGGYVYRGPVPELQGHYFFAEFVTNQIWSLRYDGRQVWDFIEWTSAIDTDIGSITSVSSFAEDNAGNLYVISRSGSIYRIDGFAEAPAPADADFSGAVDRADAARVLRNLGRTDQRVVFSDGDFDGDGVVSLVDVARLAGNLAPPASPSTVPEPSAALMLGLALAMLGLRRRFR